MEERFIRISEVQKLTGFGKSTIWSMSKEKLLPAPIKLSPRVTVWRLSEIHEWMQSRQ